MHMCPPPTWRRLMNKGAGNRSWQIRQPAAQSKLRELRQRARSACFVPVVAINKPDFLAAIENNRNFTLNKHYPVCGIIDIFGW